MVNYILPLFIHEQQLGDCFFAWNPFTCLQNSFTWLVSTWKTLKWCSDSFTWNLFAWISKIRKFVQRITHFRLYAISTQFVVLVLFRIVWLQCLVVQTKLVESSQKFVQQSFEFIQIGCLHPETWELTLSHSSEAEFWSTCDTT